MKNVVLIKARREGYAPDQIGDTMTVAELVEFLSGYNEDTPVCLSFDDGYTYGGITDNDFDFEEL